MIQKLRGKGTKIEWIGNVPDSSKRVAMLVPQFNESSNCNFTDRLDYYHQVFLDHQLKMDLIVIDDGSTDDSLEIMKEYKARHSETFYLASVSPNANKVGALFLASSELTHEIIILSDFDSEIFGLDAFLSDCSFFSLDDRLMGGYFRMLPSSGKGAVFEYQRLEYALARGLYRFHSKEGSVPVMPGAGSFYKNRILQDIYRDHSGLRSGEDREATLIGLKLGYKSAYVRDVLTLTTPPQTFHSLVRQRIRWNLGYLETFYKERAYYFREMVNFSKLGIRAGIDFFSIVFMILFPIFILVLLSGFYEEFFFALFLIYFTVVIWCLVLQCYAKDEFVELGENRISSVILFPIFKISIESMAWIVAICHFIKKQTQQIR